MARNLGINIKIGADLKNFSKDMQNVSRQMKKTGQKMQSLGKSMSAALTLPLAAAGAASVKFSADFEQSMAKVKAISGATGREFEELNANALELGRTTRYTAQQVAELQLNLSKLGFNPKEIRDSTGAILDLALATGEDLAMSATVAASTIKGFGLAATDSTMVTDVMAKAFSSSALDLEKFRTAMAVVAPVAKKAGVSMQETTAILGVLTDRGVDASSAGAALRNIYLDLADKGLSWGQAMEKMQTSQNPLSTAMELFGKRGAAVASIIADNVSSVSSLTGVLNNSAGAARGMAKTMDDTLNGSMLRLRSAVEGLAIGIGTMLTPLIRKLTDYAAGFADKLNNMSEHSKKLIVVFAGVAAAIGPVLFVLGKMNVLVAAAVPVLGKMGIAITGSLWPIAAWAAGIGMVVMAIKQLLPKTKELTDEQKRAAASAKALRDVQHSAAVEAQAQKIKLEKLNNVIKDNTIRESTRRQAISDLRKEMPSYLKSISDEELLTKGATKQIDLYVSALKSKAIAIGLQNQVQEKANRLAELEVQKAQPEIDITPTFKIDQYGNRIVDEQAAEMAKKARESMSTRINTEITELNKEIDSLLKLQSKYKQVSTSGTNIDLGGTLGGGTGRRDDIIKEFTVNTKFDIDTKDLADEYVDAMSKIEESSLGVLEPIDNVGYSLTDLAKQGGNAMTKLALDMTQALEKAKQMLGNFVSESLSGFLDALGQEMAGSTKAIDRWGEGILKSFGSFLSELGSMIIAAGTASLIAQTALFGGGPAGAVAAIAAGAALVAIGGAIKQHTKGVGDAISGDYGGNGMPVSGGYSGYGTNNSSDMITLESVIYGQDIVLSSNRQQGLSKRTR